MSKDEFAKFIASELLSIKNYNFDLFYDIRKIVDNLQTNRDSHEKPIYETLHLILRDTGCNLVRPNDENYTIYKARSTKIYELVFCYNEDYFSNEHFCIVKMLTV